MGVVVRRVRGARRLVLRVLNRNDMVCEMSGQELS